MLKNRKYVFNPGPFSICYNGLPHCNRQNQADMEMLQQVRHGGFEKKNIISWKLIKGILNHIFSLRLIFLAKGFVDFSSHILDEAHPVSRPRCPSHSTKLAFNISQKHCS